MKFIKTNMLFVSNLVFFFGHLERERENEINSFLLLSMLLWSLSCGMAYPYWKENNIPSTSAFI